MSARIQLPQVEPIAARLVELWREALDSETLAAETAEGFGWYPRARQWAAELAVEFHVSEAAVIGAIAVLSPQVSWADQKRFAAAFIRSALSRSDKLPHPGFRRNRELARAILCGDTTVERASKGRKVLAFARAIGGDPRAVTIDRHAARIALGERREIIGVRLHRVLVAAYTLAADRLEVEPRVLQSVLWCAYRKAATL